MGDLILALYALCFLLSIGATVTCGLVALFLRDDARRRAIDVMLVLGTIPVLLNFAGVLIPKDLVTRKSGVSEALAMSPTTRADIAASDLLESVYYEKMDEPWRTAAKLQGVVSVDAKLKELEDYLETLLDKRPDSCAVAARLAVVRYERGEDADKFIDDSLSRCHDRANKPVLRVLPLAYQNVTRKAELNKTQLKPDVSRDIADQIKASFRDGWYRDCALAALYRTTGSHEKLGQLETALDLKFKEWERRSQIYQLVVLGLCVSGLTFSLSVLRSRQELASAGSDTAANGALTFGFRQVYASFLCYFAANIFLSLFLTIPYSVIAGRGGRTREEVLANLSANSLVYAAALQVALACTMLIVIYFICLRPRGISVRQFFIGPARLASVASAIGWFSLAALLAVVVTIVRTNLMPWVPEGFGGEGDMEIAAAIMTGDIRMAIGAGVLACIIAPITEEWMFRGLLYSWLRGRVGIPIGIVLSSLLFGLCHFNLLNLPEYFLSGTVFALAYERSRSLLVSATVHALWNCWAMGSLLWMMPR